MDSMTTKLDKTIKREIEIDGQAYTVAISPEGVKLTQKGFRKGQELSWQQLLAAGGGDQAGAGSSMGASSGGGASRGVNAIDLRAEGGAEGMDRGMGR
jgi:hypothetical protein